MKRLVFIVLAGALSAGAYSFPLFPTIFGADFNFGAFNGDGSAEYSTNGLLADTLTYTASASDTEVTAFWPFWPSPPTYPVFNPAGMFGGEFMLKVKFDAQDAPYVGPGGVIDVSLTGTGADPAGPDLMIFGSIPGFGFPVPTLLWAIELEDVSLYGVSDRDAYVLEGVGRIVDGVIAIELGLIGETGVMRGNLDFIDGPRGWMPPLYDPLRDDVDFDIRAAYSGETGFGDAVPEPASMIALSLGLAALVARRRRKKTA